MFTIVASQLVHEIPYRSSGSRQPRELTLQIVAVRYRTDGHPAPTFMATGDLQGRESAAANRLLGEVVAEEVMVLQELGDVPPLDFCALCGDFYDYPDLRKLGGTGDVTSVLNALSRTAARTFAVLGNHDEVSIGDLLPDIRLLDGEVERLETLAIGGVSGIVGNPRRNNRKTDSEFLAAADRCLASRIDLLLLHQGPSGPNGAFRGQAALNQKLQRFSDLLVLFGHCHWREAIVTEGRNLYCNVDGRVLVFSPDNR